MNKEQFFKNEQELITNFLFNYVFNDKQLNIYKLAKLRLELIVSPECNQNCKYCYIAKFGKDLYPIEERKEKKDLINNLKILLSFLEEYKILVPGIHLFAGDMFFKDLIFFDIIQEVYNYYITIFKTEKPFFENQKEMMKIIIPTNFSFVNNDDILPQLIEWKNKFSDIYIDLIFSASIDGKFLTENRENKNITEIDQYYDKIFEAIKKLDSGLHPMVSPFGIEKWIKNYLWIMEQLKKHDIIKSFSKSYPMMLEVRDDNWTQEAIDQYLKFLDFLIQDRLQQCNNSIEELTYHLFCGDGKNNTLPSIGHYDNIKLHYKDRTEDCSSCDLSEIFCITLNNLKFVPCHRLSYAHFAGGQFNIEDNKIIGIKPINPSGYIGLQLNSSQIHSKCLECPIYSFCMKGCYGAQYETHEEPLMPNKTVCDLFIAKTKFLITKYKEIGVIDCLFTMENIPLCIKQAICKLCELYNLI